MFIKTQLCSTLALFIAFSCPNHQIFCLLYNQNLPFHNVTLPIKNYEVCKKHLAFAVSKNVMQVRLICIYSRTFSFNIVVLWIKYVVYNYLSKFPVFYTVIQQNRFQTSEYVHHALHKLQDDMDHYLDQLMFKNLSKRETAIRFNVAFKQVKTKRKDKWINSCSKLN